VKQKKKRHIMKRPGHTVKQKKKNMLVNEHKSKKKHINKRKMDKMALVIKQEKHDIKTESKQNKQVIKKEKINKEEPSTKSVLMLQQKMAVAAACNSGTCATDARD